MVQLRGNTSTTIPTQKYSNGAHTYTMEHYSSGKKNETMKFAAKLAGHRRDDIE